jgi:hypothetical protein
MVDGEKRVMMCHERSASMCPTMSAKLKTQDDVSFCVSIHVSCHVSSCHVIPKVVDG